MSESQTHRAELERIRAAYRERDASAVGAAYSFARPAYVLGMHELEWSLLMALRDAGVALDGSVLDVGCGSGYYLHRMREYGATRTTGVELMADRVAEARRRYPDLEVREGDAAALPFADDAFDVVSQFTVLSSILDGDVRDAVAREMWRVTRPGGVAVSVDMLPTSRLRRMVQSLRGTAAPHDGTPITGLTSADVSRLFPTPAVAQRYAAYHLGMNPVVTRSRVAAQLLAALPVARTHLVVVFRKP